MSSREAARDDGEAHGYERWRPWFLVALATVLVSAIVFVLVLVGLTRDGGGSGTPFAPPGYVTVTPTTDDGTAVTPTTAPGDEPTPDPTAEPGGLLQCGDILAPLNKQNALPPDCEPDDLVPVPGNYAYGGAQQLRVAARDALVELFEAAAAEGHSLVTRSTYRSYAEQEYTFNYWVQTLGRAEAERVSARPGHSEHQLGTTADVTSASVGYELSEAFGDTPEGRWVAENAWRFGFVVSYPEGKEHITGYAYEPWHIRWIGREEARRVHESGLTLHEYLQGR